MSFDNPTNGVTVNENLRGQAQQNLAEDAIEERRLRGRRPVEFAVRRRRDQRDHQVGGNGLGRSTWGLPTTTGALVPASDPTNDSTVDRIYDILQVGGPSFMIAVFFGGPVEAGETVSWSSPTSHTHQQTGALEFKGTYSVNQNHRVRAPTRSTWAAEQHVQHRA
jgi:hypothetical protein